ncbi:retinoblastoma-related protein-like [Vicia villosa]|uniref:retinoblastoma-related protein-like n=1 Tax=Vicia villosa TaxID=3911 RepID=UPI00273B7D4B|nr:retinoblastoma-related protein-like [Vicia villosa]
MLFRYTSPFYMLYFFMEQQKVYKTQSGLLQTKCSRAGAAIEYVVLHLKNELALDEKSCKETMDPFGETKHLLVANVSSMGNETVHIEETERYWFAFILYSIKKLTQKNEESGKEEIENTGLTLCRILLF